MRGRTHGIEAEVVRRRDEYPVSWIDERVQEVVHSRVDAVSGCDVALF